MERNWRATFERYLFPPLGDRRVCDIEACDVLEALQPIIDHFPKSVSRVRQRIAVVLKWAVVNGYRADNPAELITGLVPSTESRHTHHRALPYAEVPRALAAVRRCDAWPGTKLLFEFLALRAVRTEEVRGALWSEIHADSAPWIVPAARVKMRTEHRVPLSTRALAVLDEARFLPAGDGCGLVFLSQSGRKFYNNALSKLLQDLCIPCVPHGFRSSFRDWAGSARRGCPVRSLSRALRTGWRTRWRRRTRDRTSIPAGSASWRIGPSTSIPRHCRTHDTAGTARLGTHGAPRPSSTSARRPIFASA